MTLRNLKFCHLADDPQGPSSPLPTEIPTSRLQSYCDHQQGDSWNFIMHHADDPAIFMHTQGTIENCDFSLNGVGMVIICVSSANLQASITDCTFKDNFIGIVALEKDHIIKRCRFEDNYLCGLAFDKGCHTLASENLFVSNGRLDSSYGLDNYRSGILCDFSTTCFVPRIQTPFIYNNTFDSNYRAISVTEFKYMQQYMNRPCFFNNVIENRTSTIPSIFIMDCEGRCDIISMNNCFNLANGTDVIKLGAPSMNGFLTTSNLETDPLLQIPGYTLQNTSPCIDFGLYLLNPGISSIMNFPDFLQLDIGYHFPMYTGEIPDPPENLALSFTGTIITFSWDHPDILPDDYYVIMKKDDGTLV
ncbi:right-handed parallel beta-helix repeat-containing protein, partial [bacterium]|nr:right-handed parallel beta-helix repeat-containing protein [bacterium]